MPNNLKQIGLAIHNFHDTYNHLPSSLRPAGAGSNCLRHSTLTFLLPYLEQANLFTNYVQSYNWWVPNALPTSGGTVDPANPNGWITSQPISTFVCPSSPNPARLDGDPDSSTWTPVVAISDYGATIGVDPALSSSLNWSGGTLAASGGTASGALYRVGALASTRFADIKDGLSNTILYAESAGRPYIYQNGVDVSYVNSVPKLSHHSRQRRRLGSSGVGDYSPGFRPDGHGSLWQLRHRRLRRERHQRFSIRLLSGEQRRHRQRPHRRRFGTLPTGEIYAFHPGGQTSSLPMDRFAC